MNRRFFSLLAIICVGALLLTGCTGSNAEGSKSDEQISDTQYVPDVANDGRDVSSDGGDVSNKEDNNTEKSAHAVDAFSDANDMFESADLTGEISGCSDSGCMISITLYVDDISLSGGGGTAQIVYSDDTVFQKSTVAADGSTFSLTDCEKSDLKDNAQILFFGALQTDDTYLAERIISVQYSY
jgi:hypothetical protein